MFTILSIMRVEINKNLKKESVEFTRVRGQVVISTNTPNEFLAMINKAYGRHLGVEITPDDINLIICYYLAQNVNKHPDHYRPFMGAGQEQLKEIIIWREEDFDITVEANALGVFDEFIAAVAAHNPESQLNALTNDFSTTTPLTRLCSQVSLAFMVKQFYGLHVGTLCGIPYVDIAGTTDDWQKIKDKLRVFKAMAHPSIYGYLASCEEAIDHFIAPTLEAFSNFFEHGACSSGHSNYSGLILKFFNEKWPDHDIKEVPSTRIEYKFKIGPLAAPQDININAGPLGATQLEDGTLKMVYDYYFDTKLPSFTRMSRSGQEIDVEFGSIDWTPYNYRDYRFNGLRIHDIPEVAEYVNNDDYYTRNQGKIIFDGRIWLSYREEIIVWRRQLIFDKGKIAIGEPEIAPVTFLAIPPIWKQPLSS